MTSLSNFDFLDPPSEDSITRSLELLYSLGVLDLKGELTIDLGQKLGEFPLETRLSVMLLNSFKEEFACSEEILILVSLLASGGTIFYTNSSSGSILKAKKRFGAKEGDLITMINLFLRYNHISNRNERKKFCSENNLNENQLISAKRISEQLRCSLKTLKLTVKSSEDDIEAILRCITTAFFSHAAQRTKTGSYRGVRGAEILFLHPTSILNTSYPEWVLYYEIVRTGKVYMRECIEIDYKWLVELAPHFYQDNKASKLEERHRREVNRGEDANFKGKEGDLDKRERDLEKWTEEKPRFNRILESLKEGGVVFGKKKEVFNRKKEGSNELELKKDKKNKNTLSFDYEDI